MEKLKPLAKFPVTATDDVEEAEFFLSQTLTDVQINRVDDRCNFRLDLNAVKFERCSLLYNCFRAQTNLTTNLDIDYAIFVTSMGRPITLFVDNEQHLVTQSKAAIIANAEQIRIVRPANSEILYLRVSLSDLWNQFERLTGRHHRGSLNFNRTTNVFKGSGAMLKGLMDYLVSTLAYDESAVKVPAIRKSVDDFLMNSMLALPHNKLDQLFEDRSGIIAPAVVCRAEEYMRAHLENQITISDLVRVCNCSRSVLFSAFRNAREYTPMEFLTEQRLHHARELLLKSSYNASVSAIASDCGFVSPSWFSQVYKKRFGERPSGTLRKRK